MHSTCASSVKMRVAPCVVDLSASSEEDDDEDLVELKEFPAHLSQRGPRRLRPSNAFRELSPWEVLDEVEKTLELIGTTQESWKESQKESQIEPQKEFQKEARNDSQKSSQNSIVLDDDDCCILSEDPSRVDVVKSSCDDDSDELVMTGEVGQVACRDYPHSRHLCARFPFKTTSHETFCSQCHCYVCDVKAPCSLWGDGRRGGDHCHASDKTGERWETLRQYNKTHPTGCSDPTITQHLLSPGARPSSTTTAGNREAPSAFRGSSACCSVPDSSPRTQHPLQISLNRSNRDLSSACPKRYLRYDPGLGIIRTKAVPQGFARRKESHYSSVHISYHPADEGDGGFRRRNVRKGRCSRMPPPHSSSNTSSRHSSDVASAAVPSRTPTTSTAASENSREQSVRGAVPFRNTVSSNDYLEEYFASQTPPAAAPNSDMTGQEPQQQSPSLRSVPHPSHYFVGAAPPSGNVSGANNSHPQWNGGGKYGQSIYVSGPVVDSLHGEGGRGENKAAAEDIMPSFPATPPTLLADYLLHTDSFWDDSRWDLTV